MGVEISRRVDPSTVIAVCQKEHHQDDYDQQTWYIAGDTVQDSSGYGVTQS
jgi:hypothetical protein